MGIFPHPSLLLNHPDPDGLLAVGGQLSPQVLIEAYSKGIFPWPVTEGSESVLAWFCPPQRAVLEFKELHIPRSLSRQASKKPFTFTFNTDFESVIRACASVPRKGQRGTWITPQMIEAYLELHRLDRAWSVEARNPEGDLVGGIYGVRSDQYFSAESMFHHETGASKLALLELIRILKERGLLMIDIQMLTPHLKALGAREITRRQFFMKLGLL
ncbi:MAG: leucyl/phenylalanyl-tRNA--protein transferase [Oligoflexia bacterium]|jgi:leucyl/phenylalanyl-tRNA--protein transferase